MAGSKARTTATNTKTKTKTACARPRSKKKSRLSFFRLVLSVAFVVSIAFNIQAYLEKENVMKLLDYANINNYNLDFMGDVCKRVEDNKKKHKLLH